MSLEKRLNLGDDESPLAVVRDAPVTLMLPVMASLLLILAPLFFLLPLLRLGLLGEIVVGVSETLGVLFGLRLMVKWIFSLLVVTERRLIAVKQKGFFDKNVTELPIFKIQDVSYRVKGVWPTIFRYGTLIVEPVGGESLEFHRVGRPSSVQGLIREMQERSGRGPGDFGEMLHAVSKMDLRRLSMLRAEIDRTLKMVHGVEPESGWEEDEGAL